MNNRNLTLDELKYVQNEVKYKGKSMIGSYMLTLFFWPIGINRAYLGKRKSGIIRLTLTALTLLTSVTIANSAISLGLKDISEALISSTLLAMIFVGLTSASLIMLITELFLIPKWIKEIDSENRELAINKALRARYVSEHLMKEQISKELMEDIKEDVKQAIDVKAKTLIDELSKELTNKDKSSLPKVDKVFDVVDLDEDSPIEEVDKYLNDLPQKSFSESLNVKQAGSTEKELIKEDETRAIETTKETMKPSTEASTSKKTESTSEQQPSRQEEDSDNLNKYTSNEKMSVTIGELMEDRDIDLFNYTSKKEE